MGSAFSTQLSAFSTQHSAKLRNCDFGGERVLRFRMTKLAGMKAFAEC
jgi:hypothetical protein